MAARFEEAAEVFERANEVLGFDLKSVCLGGPEEELNRTDISQPAILTTSWAVLRVIENRVVPVSDLGVVGAAGLSLGEYSALVAAGSLEFADALRLVRRRGQYMQEACDATPGTMYSVIGLDDETVEKACEEVLRETGGGVWPANYNCPGQVVISGQCQSVERAAALCEERGARRAVRLSVAGAFHTELMQPAADKLAADLEQTEFARPSFPVVANAVARPAEGPEEVPELLARQMSSPVHWTASMRWLIDRGAERFYEIGPGRVLRGLLRRIDRGAECTSVGSANDVEQLREALGQ